MKTVIWGMGGMMESYMMRKGLHHGNELVAFVDNNTSLWGKNFLHVPVLSPEELKGTEFDQVIICVADETDIKRQLLDELMVDEAKITSIREIDEYYMQKLIEKYKDSEDQEIQRVLLYYKENGVSVFGAYAPDTKDYEVFRDEEKHPYVIYEGKRLYYPDHWRFKRRDGKEWLSDIMYEQKAGSPHLYIRDESVIPSGSVVVDAGTCEGNFAIRFVDKVSRLYLIEADSVWAECLERTFRPFRDKTIICNKALAGYDSKNTITLDSLLKGQKLDFLKMDIEGAEVDALSGARDTLLNNKVHCAICSYHRMNDEKDIRSILEGLGYRTEVSEGYMFFAYDEHIYDTLDFRRGIVYAEAERK